MKCINLIIVILAMAVAATSCKTSEKNYREAYERTIAGDSTRTAFEQTIYGAQRRAVQHGAIVSGTDSVATQRLNCRITPKQAGVTADSLHKYNVCVASFKQLFNATSVRNRLKDNGYPNAFIVQTTEPFYYVVALSTSDMAVAVAALRTLADKPPFRLPAAPFLLLPNSYK